MIRANDLIALFLYEGDDLMENPTLARGAKGAAVVRLQEALLAQGYALPKYGADGSFGAETEAAVKAAQRDAGFPVTGVCDAQTCGFLTEQDGENGDSAVVQQPSAPTGEEDTARIPKALYDALSAFFKGV